MDDTIRSRGVPPLGSFRPQGALAPFPGRVRPEACCCGRLIRNRGAWQTVREPAIPPVPAVSPQPPPFRERGLFMPPEPYPRPSGRVLLLQLLAIFTLALTGVLLLAVGKIKQASLGHGHWQGSPENPDFIKAPVQSGIIRGGPGDILQFMFLRQRSPIRQKCFGIVALIHMAIKPQSVYQFMDKRSV